MAIRASQWAARCSAAMHQERVRQKFGDMANLSSAQPRKRDHKRRSVRMWQRALLGVPGRGYRAAGNEWMRQGLSHVPGESYERLNIRTAYS